MNVRRKILIGAPAFIGLAAIGTVAYSRHSISQLTSAPLAELRTQLGQIPTGGWTSQTAWNPSQVFSHLAQSIEYSLSGFPQDKGALFQSTVGPIAFATFASRGVMSHSLVEPIPAAPDLDPTTPIAEALERLFKAIELFLAGKTELKPHFAYGQLNRNAYSWAHWMHIQEHLTKLSAK